MQSTEYRFGTNRANAIEAMMWRRQRRKQIPGRIGNARTQSHMRAAVIVVADPRFQHLPQMSFR